MIYFSNFTVCQWFTKLICKLILFICKENIQQINKIVLKKEPKIELIECKFFEFKIVVKLKFHLVKRENLINKTFGHPI